MNEMEYRERIIIWGAGTLGASRLLCELLEMKYVIFAYCDSDDNKCGTVSYTHLTLPTNCT